MKFLSTSEVAERLDIHPATVSRWIGEGYFPNAFKAGLSANSHYKIPETDVIAFEEKIGKPNLEAEQGGP